MPQIEWDSGEAQSRRRRGHKASTVHGWVTKMRGTLLGSESTRRLGIREMKEARAIRRYKKEHPEAFRSRKGDTVLWIFPRRGGQRVYVQSDSHRSHSHAHSHSHSHRSHSHGHAHSHSHSHHSRSHSRRRHHHDDPPYDRHGYRYDDRYRERYSGRHPFLHFHHRVKSHHHGLGTLLAGILLGKEELKQKGRYLRQLAAKERHRERHRRRRQRREEAHAMKRDWEAYGNRWWHR